MSSLSDVDMLNGICEDFGWFHMDNKRTTAGYEYRTFGHYMRGKNKKFLSDSVDGYMCPNDFFSNLTDDKLQLIIKQCHHNGHCSLYEYMGHTRFMCWFSVIRYSIDKVDCNIVSEETIRLLRGVFEYLKDDVDEHLYVKDFLKKSKNIKLLLKKSENIVQ